MKKSIPRNKNENRSMSTVFAQNMFIDYEIYSVNSVKKSISLVLVNDYVKGN